MKIRFFKITRWMLVAVMGLLGLVACSKDDGDGGFETMYGVQETTYRPIK